MSPRTLLVVFALTGCAADATAPSTGATAESLVGDAAAFVQAVGTPNAIVRLAPGAQIDLSGLENIQVAPGVQILGDATEPRIFTTTFPRVFLLIAGDGVRVSGVRIQGGESDDPFSAVDQTDSNGVQIESAQRVEIDHCQIDHWRGAAVAVLDFGGRLDLAHAASVWIHDDFIHHNQHPTADTIIPGGGHGAGYGVQMSHGAYALIERNVFDWNRHDIMGDGSAGTGYLAYRNLILPHGGINSREVGFTIHTHAIDMHGSDTCGLFGGDHNCGLAGEYMDVQYNTVLYTEAASVHLRGTPSLGMHVANNVFAVDDEDDAIEENETGLEAANNAFDVDATGEERSCDFDGDGVADAFLATGVTWWYAASSRGGRWVYLDNSVKRAAELALGDFNGDGRCDVAGESAGVLYVGPNGPWRAAAVAHGSPIAAARNADGRLLLVGASGAGVARRVQGTAGDPAFGAWSAFDGWLSAVAAATNADGRVEIFGVNSGGSIWRRAQTAAGADAWTPWAQLDGLLVSVAAARNADGRLELFGTNAAGNIWHRAQLAPGSSAYGPWQAMDGLLATVALAANADGRLELVGVNGAGQIFRRAQTAPNATTWTAWAQLDGLLTQVALARDGDGRLALFGTSSAGTVWRRAQTAAGAAAYTPWAAFDGEPVRSGRLAAALEADGRLEVFAVDHAGQVAHRAPAADGGWSAWAHLEGTVRAAVPDVRWLTQADAVAALQAAGYAVSAVPYVDPSCSLPPGYVVVEDPPGGPAVLLSNAPVPAITIWVSQPPNPADCNG